MHSFEHNFALVYPTWRVSTKLYQLQHVTTCKFSLKRHVSAPFWLTMTCPCSTFNICGHDWVETFHCCEHRIGPWDAFTVKRRPSTQLFDLRKRICATNIKSHHVFFQLASRRYTWILIPPCDFLTYKSFDEIDWQGAPLPFSLPLS